LISSGPDRSFQASCDTAAGGYVDGPFGDDIIFSYYVDGTTNTGSGGGGGGGGGSGGLWSDSGLAPDVIEYDTERVLVGNIAAPGAEQLQVEDDVIVTGAIDVTGTSAVENLQLGNGTTMTVDSIDADQPATTIEAGT